MHRLAIFGIGGRMGRALVDVLHQSQEFVLSGAVDSLHSADVALDFSHASAVARHAEACAGAGVALLVATTGLDIETHRVLERAATKIPLIVAPNTSLGVNLLARLVALAAQVLDEEFDADIAEVHHRNKLDAPSGTALKLAAAVARARGVDLDGVRFDALASAGQVRPRGSIGFAVSRSGDIVGEHTVSFSGNGEHLYFTHRATDRACFARGALRAARWLIGRPAGLYSMDEVLGIQAM